MNSNLYRQLKDIQYQSEKLISGNPDQELLEQFNHYNEELKAYLIDNIEEQEIRNLVGEIPNILDIKIEAIHLQTSILIIIGILTLGIFPVYLSYITEMRKNKLIQENIHTTRGKYASIEFLLKAR